MDNRASVGSPDGLSLSSAEKLRGQRLVILCSLPGIVFILSMGQTAQIFFTALHMTPMQVGLLGSLVSLMGYAQLLTSLIAEHFGRKRVFLVFQGATLVVALALPVLPLLARYGSETTAIRWTMTTFVAISLCYNLSSSTWFAMLKDMTDPGSRGAFFSRMRMIWGTVSLTYFFLIWLVFQGGDSNIPMWGFTVIFALGAVCGWIRYFIVQRFPVVSAEPAHGVLRTFGIAVRSAWSSRRFRQHVAFYGAFAFVFGLVDPFLVLYIKYQLRLNDTTVNLVRVFWQLGGLGGLWMIGRVLDRVGPHVVFLWTTGVMVGMLVLLMVPTPGMAATAALLCLVFMTKGFAEFGYGLANTDSLLLSVESINPALVIVLASIVNLTSSSVAQLISGRILTRYAAWHGHLLDFNIYKVLFLLAAVLFTGLIGLRFLVKPPGRAPVPV